MYKRQSLSTKDEFERYHFTLLIIIYYSIYVHVPTSEERDSSPMLCYVMFIIYELSVHAESRGQHSTLCFH